MAELADRLAGGEPAAFAELYDLCADRLHHWLLRHTGSRTDADDVVQETFLRLARPMILRLMDAKDLAPTFFRVRADFEHHKKRDRREWVRAHLVDDGAGGVIARKFPRDGAGILSSLVRSDGLVELPEDITQSEDLPDSWPDDFPLYPEAELEGVITSTEEGASGDVATFQTNDSLDDVTAFYEAEFDGGAWETIEEPLITADSASFLVQQSSGGHADSSVTITPENGNTAIVVLITQED